MTLHAALRDALPPGLDADTLLLAGRAGVVAEQVVHSVARVHRGDVTAEVASEIVDQTVALLVGALPGPAAAIVGPLRVAITAAVRELWPGILLVSSEAELRVEVDG